MTFGNSNILFEREHLTRRRSSPITAGTFRNVATFLALIICYGGATILSFTVGFEQLSPLMAGMRYGLVGSGLGIILFLGVTEKKEVVNRPKTRILITIWMLFSLANVTAAIVFGDVIYATLTECWLLLGVPLFFFYLLPRSAVGCIHRINTNTVILITVGYLLYSLYESPNLHFLYRGVFGHPNQVGVLGSTLSVGCMGVLLSKHRGGRKLKIRGLILLALLLAIGISAILVSGSRTALLGLASASFMGIFFVRRAVRRLMISAALALALIASFLSIGTETGIAWVDAILQKHQNQSRTGDVLSGRTVIWETILGDAKIFGNGSTYFANSVGISAHNTFLNALGQRGIISCLLLVAFAVLSLILTFKCSLNAYLNEPEMIGSFLFIVHFWTLSIGEATLSSLGTVISLSFYAAMGSIINQSKNLPLQFRQLSAVR